MHNKVTSFISENMMIQVSRQNYNILPELGWVRHYFVKLPAY